MRSDQLAELIEEPEFHQWLVQNFGGAYSVGIGRDPKKPNEPALILQVEGNGPPSVPDEVELEGEKIAVITKTGFKAPRPLQSREVRS